MKKYVEISNYFRNKIVEGKYKANDKLPSESEVGAKFDASKMTVKKAIDILVDEGIVSKRRGAGTFVKSINPIEMEQMVMANQFRGTTALNPNHDVTSTVHLFETVKSPENVASKLNIAQNAPVYKIERVRNIDGKPVVMETTYMPVAIVPSLSLGDVESSIYDYLEHELKLAISTARRIITVRKATTLESERLSLEPHDPVAVVEQVGFLNNGSAFEYSFSVHRYDEYAFEIILHRKVT
ncbi:GntR family transcriptional regulator [Lactococcus hodotermopsidis]|uniref:GntR family transcriptional regulator n=1 Tax=Pseudolactococcus hodotermopsidis TaxID=2709157 RepID=A0A6A0BGL7_9LACT|nr:GntR family transcriptional regulator [Lactococcus hodotermopsidis]GFH43411.1 GntR family transcriptional regulator [Lactococcus hodotermopsidis]